MQKKYLYFILSAISVPLIIGAFASGAFGGPVPIGNITIYVSATLSQDLLKNTQPKLLDSMQKNAVVMDANMVGQLPKLTAALDKVASYNAECQNPRLAVSGVQDTHCDPVQVQLTQVEYQSLTQTIGSSKIGHITLTSGIDGGTGQKYLEDSSGFVCYYNGNYYNVIINNIAPTS